MKKNLIWAILFSFGLGVAVQAESISSISYNPSRLGLYQQLRVTDTLKSKGNVKVSDKAFIKGNTTLFSTNNDFEIKYTNASSGTVYMPKTDLNVTDLDINGGKAAFQGGSLPNLLRDTRIMAKSLNMGSVKINHDRPEGSVKGYDADIRGLKLGGNDIPLPPTDCTGNLVWAKQKIGDKIQEVLAVTGCAEQSASSCSWIKTTTKIQWWDGESCQVYTCPDTKHIDSHCGYNSLAIDTMKNCDLWCAANSPKKVWKVYPQYDIMGTGISSCPQTPQGSAIGFLSQCPSNVTEGADCTDYTGNTSCYTQIYGPGRFAVQENNCNASCLYTYGKAFGCVEQGTTLGKVQPQCNSTGGNSYTAFETGS